MDDNRNSKFSYKIRQKRLSKATYNRFNLFIDNRYFFVVIVLLLGIAFFITDYPTYACWFGFLVAAYGMITNDSIQTLGVFITANAHRTAWSIMWLFVGLIFLVTVGISWYVYEGDISYTRLDTTAFPPTSKIKFSQLLAPIILLVITRFGIPVSTTFLLMITFVQQAKFTTAIVKKSIWGYSLAFIMAFAAWGMQLARQRSKRHKYSKPGKKWFVLQWVSSGFLWAGWLIQDGINMAIFLPRQLNFIRFTVFILIIFALLGLLFRTQGGKMQQIVNSKTGITDIRAAFYVNLFYSILLFGFTIWNKTPMSTTWMFIGLLGGRELASGIWLQKNHKQRKRRVKKSLFLIKRDLIQAFIGLIVSIILGACVNDYLQKKCWSWLGL